MNAENSSRMRVRAICEGAIFVALSWALSYLKLDLWFQGGSVDLVMIPLIIFAVRWGAGWGMGAGLIFGTLKFFLAGGFAIGWQSIVFDYTLAYMVVGLAGLCRGRTTGAVWGSVVGGAARFLIHYISGITIYASYMPDSFMGMTMTSPYIYSALYNGAYMVPNTIIAVVAGLLLAKPLGKYLTGSDLR